VLVNDGNLRLVVEACGRDHADCTVLVGGEISNRKGVNLPDVVLPLPALTQKDRTDLDFVCELGVDWLALSFVQRPEDVEEARRLVRGRAAVLAKIEKPAAVERFERSSPPPTASWWRAATSASSRPSRTCRQSRNS
jgi:pyruvate kinase